MNIRVLICDDQELARAGLRFALESTPELEIVGEAENGRMAVERANELEPDVVLMDVVMPPGNGMEATRQILETHAGIKVLALSMHLDARFAKAMLGAGAAGYLLKSEAFEELGAAIRTVLAGKTYLSPELKMDIRLRGAMDGIAAARQIRERFCRPVVFLTANTEDATLHRAKAAEPFGYVIKPFEDRELRTVIEMALYKHQAEERLRSSQAELDAVFANAPSIMCLLDAERRVRRINRAGVAFAGRPAAALLGQCSGAVLGCAHALDDPRGCGFGPECHACGLQATLLDTLATGRSQHRVECQLAIVRGRPGHPVTVLGSTTLIPVDGQALVLLCLEDISEQKQAEAARSGLETQLRQVQKMQAIGTLAGGIAHDFNNILGAIVASLHLIKTDLPADHPTQEWLDLIQKATSRATDLVQQILAFSRQREQNQQPVKLQVVIKEVMRLLRAATPAGVELSSRVMLDTPSVLADPSQIHQVLMNLCTNALQALPERGGRIELGLAVTEVEAGFAARHEPLRPGRHLVLSVSDNGRGIEAATLARIFDPFFTTKPIGQGTGLGLSVVQGIVQSHGSAVAVRSEPGHGSVFDVYLPALESPLVAEVETSEPVPRGQGERLLFLDDEEPLGRATRLLLTSLGYQVKILTDPAEAWKAFRAHPKEFDLAIVDLNMPGLTGVEVAAQFWQLRPELPILLTTGFSDKLDADGARDLGFREMILKPYTPLQIGAALRRALSGDAAAISTEPPGELRADRGLETELETEGECE